MTIAVRRPRLPGSRINVRLRRKVQPDIFSECYFLFARGFGFAGFGS